MHKVLRMFCRTVQCFVEITMASWTAGHLVSGAQQMTEYIYIYIYNTNTSLLCGLHLGHLENNETLSFSPQCFFYQKRFDFTLLMFCKILSKRRRLSIQLLLYTQSLLSGISRATLL